MKKKNRLLMFFAAAFLLAVSSPAMADTGGPDEFGYTYADSTEAAVTYEWVDISGDPGTVVLTFTDDDNSDAIALPFSFNYYGVDYSNVYIHSNGFLKFDAETFEHFMGDQCPLPKDDEVNGIVAFFLRDFNPAEADGGTVSYLIDSVSDPQRFIVTFDSVPVCCSPYDPGEGPNPASVQVILYSNNEIQVNVHDPGPKEGGDTTIGIEAPGAISGISYRGCLLSESVVADTAVRFYPPAGGTPALPKVTKHWGRPGDELTFDYWIFNLDPAAVNFTIAESTSAWSPILSAASLTLNPGESSPFTVTVTIPGDASDGAGDVATVTFTPDSGDPRTVEAISLVQAEELEWQQLPDVPMAMEQAGAATVDNYIFVTGGIRLDTITETAILEDAVHRYDVSTNTWVSSEDGAIESLPYPRGGHAACGMDGKVYVMGGYGEIGADAQIAQDLYIYDVAANTWDTGALMTHNKLEFAAVCDQSAGNIYAMGGWSNPDGTALADASLSDALLVYDAAGDSWSEAAAMTGTRIGIVAGMPDGNTIIVAGGYYNGWMSTSSERYSITGDVWTLIDDLTVHRIYPAGGVLPPGRFCVAGGFNTDVGREDTFECFDDPYWIPQIALLNVARVYMTSITSDGQIYAINGNYVNESVDPPEIELSAAFERYPASPIPDPTEEPVDEVEPLPDALPDADVIDDVPPDVAPDADAATDTLEDPTTDPEQEGENGNGGDDGCGCHMVY